MIKHTQLSDGWDVLWLKMCLLRSVMQRQCCRMDLIGIRFQKFYYACVEYCKQNYVPFKKRHLVLINS